MAVCKRETAASRRNEAGGNEGPWSVDVFLFCDGRRKQSLQQRCREAAVLIVGRCDVVLMTSVFSFTPSFYAVQDSL